MTCAAPLLPQFQNDHAQQTLSLTFNVCKVLEVAFKEKMLAQLSQFSLLTSRQHGLLPQRSTLSILLMAEELITNWLRAVDSNYLDFSKPFNSVNHRLLLLIITNR